MKSGFTSVSARISLTLVSFMLLASISPFALAESNKQDLSSEVMIGDLSDFEPSIEGKQYMFTKNSFIWDVFFRMALFGLRRISYKINFEGYDPYAFRSRDIPTITKMVF